MIKISVGTNFSLVNIRTSFLSGALSIKSSNGLTICLSLCNFYYHKKMKRILVPTDYSEQSRRAYKFAFNIADQQRGFEIKQYGKFELMKTAIT